MNFVGILFNPVQKARFILFTTETLASNTSIWWDTCTHTHAHLKQMNCPDITA